MFDFLQMSPDLVEATTKCITLPHLAALLRSWLPGQRARSHCIYLIGFCVRDSFFRSLDLLRALLTR